MGKKCGPSTAVQYPIDLDLLLGFFFKSLIGHLSCGHGHAVGGRPARVPRLAYCVQRRRVRAQGAAGTTQRPAGATHPIGVHGALGGGDGASFRMDCRHGLEQLRH